MIHGHATPAGTHKVAKQFPSLTFNAFGESGLLVSNAGFGCYRVNAGVVAHEKALKKAMTSGINLIDTSANYADGGSEQLVGQVLKDLFEPGAAIEQNQPDGQTVLEVARENRLGVLINRPLNAFTGRRMVRLSAIEVRSRMDYKEIIHCIKDLAQSEARLWRKILPDMESVPSGLRIRIKQQGCFAETLKHHWRTFGSYERWREARDGIFLPRIQGVMDFLNSHTENNPDLAAWIPSHEKTLDRAFRAVASIYADDAVALEKKIHNMIAQADEAWGQPGNLSQKAIRAVASTAGVSTVLVGMRKEVYVSDVLAGLHDHIKMADRTAPWHRLKKGAQDVFPN